MALDRLEHRRGKLWEEARELACGDDAMEQRGHEREVDAEVDAQLPCVGDGLVLGEHLGPVVEQPRRAGLELVHPMRDGDPGGLLRDPAGVRQPLGLGRELGAHGLVQPGELLFLRLREAHQESRPVL